MTTGLQSATAPPARISSRRAGLRGSLAAPFRIRGRHAHRTLPAPSLPRARDVYDDAILRGVFGPRW